MQPYQFKMTLTRGGSCAPPLIIYPPPAVSLVSLSSLSPVKHYEYPTLYTVNLAGPPGPGITHFHLPQHWPNHSRGVCSRRRLFSLQVPHMVMGRRIESSKTGILPSRWQAVPGYTRSAMSSETERQLCRRCRVGG